MSFYFLHRFEKVELAKHIAFHPWNCLLFKRFIAEMKKAEQSNSFWYWLTDVAQGLSKSGTSLLTPSLERPNSSRGYLAVNHWQVLLVRRRQILRASFPLLFHVPQDRFQSNTPISAKQPVLPNWQNIKTSPPSLNEFGYGLSYTTFDHTINSPKETIRRGESWYCRSQSPMWASG